MLKKIVFWLKFKINKNLPQVLFNYPLLQVKNKFPLLPLAVFMAYQANPEIDTFNESNGVKNPN